MAQVRKQFSRSLYEAYDGPARTALVLFLENNGHTIVNNEENYSVDVVSQKGGHTYFNEAEVKTGWKSDWPVDWKEIRIPERKQRLLDKNVDWFLNFYVFRADLRQVWRIKDTLLTKDSLREAKGRFIKKGELFFHVPFTKAELINL